MKNIVVKYWTIYIVLVILIYIGYRIAIFDISQKGNGFFATILYFLDILINLGFSLFYLAAMLVCSFAVFLNLVKKIRDNYLLSWLAFSGAPILLAAIMIIKLYIDGYHGDLMTKILVVGILYPFITTVLFLKFRKTYLSNNWQ